MRTRWLKPDYCELLYLHAEVVVDGLMNKSEEAAGLHFDLFIEADKTELVTVWCLQGSERVCVFDLIFPRLFSSRLERTQ